jgi:hypothetical protein
VCVARPDRQPGAPIVRQQGSRRPRRPHARRHNQESPLRDRTSSNRAIPHCAPGRPDRIGPLKQKWRPRSKKEACRPLPNHRAPPGAWSDPLQQRRSPGMTPDGRGGPLPRPSRLRPRPLSWYSSPGPVRDRRSWGGSFGIALHVCSSWPPVDSNALHRYSVQLPAWRRWQCPLNDQDKVRVSAGSTCA